MADPSAAKKGGMSALALIFGKGRGGGKPSPDSEPSDDMDVDAEESEGEVPDDFADYIVQAFPDLEGSPDRQMAMWKAVKACVGAGGEY